MIICYNGYAEVLVCDEDSEDRLIDEFFVKGWRNIDEYDRNETEYCFEIQKQ